MALAGESIALADVGVDLAINCDVLWAARLSVTAGVLLQTHVAIVEGLEAASLWPAHASLRWAPTVPSHD